MHVLKIESLGAPGLLQLAEKFSDIPGTALFYSGGSYRASQKNILCLFPSETIKIAANPSEDPWQELKSRLVMVGSLPVEWAGFIHYEMGFFAESFDQVPCEGELLAFFQRPAAIFIQNREESFAKLYIREPDSIKDPFQQQWLERFAHLEKWPQILSEITKKEKVPDAEPAVLLNPIEPLPNYLEKVAKAKEEILNGNVYQLNLSHKMTFKTDKQPFQIFSELIQINPAPFSAYLCLGSGKYIVSSSPERFLKCEKGFLETCPIKGTAPRQNDREADNKSYQYLLESSKERAELLMITDLMRNDLGKVCQAATIEVEKIWHPEKYANVFHLSSIIKGRPKKELHPVDIIKSCFPGGSITGCPKISAMKKIWELEGRKRGIYTGSIGYLSGQNDFNLNIAIRTISFDNGVAEVQLGGGIVIDSDPVQEYRETLHKGASIFKALDYTQVNSKFGFWTA